MSAHLDHYTDTDPSLTHQVIFGLIRGKTVVSCNCRARFNPVWKNRTASWMGETHNLDEARELYNNPENHFQPFSREDEAKW